MTAAATAPQQSVGTQRAIAEQLSSPYWRINHLYKIVDDDGNVLDFQMKPVQELFYHDLHYRNIILKARQHGFTTLMAIVALDDALWNDNFSAGIIAHTKPDAMKIFRKKVKFAYENLSDFIKSIAPAVTKETADELEFENGSSVSVSVSFRGGTLQFLHVSELGKIAAKHPNKAEEIRTGAFEAVPKNGIIIVESTAEGNHGDFKDMVDKAQATEDQGRELTQLDFRLHFVPWYKDPKYKLTKEETALVPIPQRLWGYFTRLADEYGIKLTPRQKAWYVLKEENLGQMIWREYPSTPDEPFKVSLDGAYWARQMRKARVDGRITRVPIQTQIPVDTWWDIGRDTTAIWLTQDSGLQVHVVGYMQDSGEGLQFYNRMLNDWKDLHDIRFGEHSFPHDMKVTEWAADKPRIEQAREMGLYGRILPRMNSKSDGIEAGRNFIQYCIFDEEACEEGIAGLEAYRKEWDQIKGVWKDSPLHNFASHPADAFQGLALSHEFAVQINGRAREVTHGRSF